MHTFLICAVFVALAFSLDRLKIKPLVALIALPFIYYFWFWVALGLIVYWGLVLLYKKI